MRPIRANRLPGGPLGKDPTIAGAGVSWVLPVLH
jgi:hypothetical protein